MHDQAGGRTFFRGARIVAAFSLVRALNGRRELQHFHNPSLYEPPHGLTQVYKELLLLNHWVVVSYCGFNKILKKHDRWTGFITKEKVHGFARNNVEIKMYRVPMTTRTQLVGQASKRGTCRTYQLSAIALVRFEPPIWYVTRTGWDRTTFFTVANFKTSNVGTW